MEGTRTKSLFASAAVVVALGATGCGGGERQDENEPSGTFQVSADASFPESQTLAKQERFKVNVRNTGDETVPNVAVTVDSFSSRSDQPGLADPDRPVWIIDNGPEGGVTAYTNTWALGRLEPGQSKEFVWRVTAIRPGTHSVKWRVAAGLDGKAKAAAGGGRAPEGEFTVDVADEPVESRVDPETGRVVRETE